MTALAPLRTETDQRFAPARMRRTVLEMAYAGSTVHIGCAFSIIELLTVLYRNYLRYPENNPLAEGRDYLVLSKGHGVMAQYACMRELGWLNDSHIQNYFKDGSELKGLSDSRVAGLEVTSGSLGHGFSVGVGIAMGLQRKGTDQKVYAIVGDGELNEGPIWEGALVAAHHRMDNLMLIVDKNGFQAMGSTDDVLALGDLSAKFASFGFETLEVDGHDEAAIEAAIHQLWANGLGKPKALIARTVKGKGVPFMESDNRWHYTRLNAQTFAKAINALGLTGATK
ncbi:transketolase [Craterilacuibacter sinensis]|uniref:Transketolase n=1 Tax=Craterilacuibacter sinensis TaxID=2686017 RepID=A0A845BQH3_9NEIS|nr:transketolase [Craterilacuibacter sinensis]MXR37650.1 transketolase [Craterilacuibacter sinensis]